MNYHAQNLSDGKHSIFWWGRAWLELLSRRFRTEWIFGRRAGGPSFKIEFGEGDSDADLTLHFSVPWIFSLWLTIENVWRTKPFWIGFYIYEKVAYCISIAAFTNEKRHNDPWYRKTIYRDFPWALTWHSTEILCESAETGWAVVYREDRKTRKCRDTFEVMREKEAAEIKVSSKWPYRYVLKNGTVQDVVATMHVNRMEWRARWWPIIPIKKSRTSISVDFSDEVGEGTGSWKGGTIGCGYDMLPGEKAIECLRRMERERKFDR